MNAQLKKGVLELCVLSRISRSDCYGYELTEHVSKEMELATGTLYLILKRLRDEGFVETYLVDGGSGPARKYYHLTESGWQEYRKQYEEYMEFSEAVKRLLGEEKEE
ncbi:PadR family transcriptional regulator, regulatory protein PadR [Lachnospiraceae bacterium XBB1006]|nr:PadR family transcriptional regulator, regulatory protein PadR [Lachnospiraceae bacterium XBB1006]